MMYPRVSLGCRAPLLAALLGALLAATPAPAVACSLAPFVWFRVPGVVAFLGTALDDTLQAGPGPVRYRLDDGHSGRGVDRSIHGQVVRVDRLARTWRELLGPALANARDEVVLVPWDYAADCTPVPWANSARWLAPGTRGFFTATLRDSVGWVAGRPTLDVVGPEYRPFPSAPALQRAFRTRSGPLPADSILTAEQMLELYDVLPRSDQSRDPAEVRYVAVWRWADEHPDLARRQPVAQLLRRSRIEARTEPEERRIMAIQSPLAGTYRFVFTLGSGDSLVVFARSEERPTSLLWSETPRSAQGQDADTITRAPMRAAGYHLLIEAGRSVDELPRRRGSGMGPSRQGYLNVVEQPAVATRDSTVWRVGLDLGRVAGDVVGNDAATRELREVERARYELFRTGELTFTPGRLVRYADGRMRFHEAIHRGVAPLLTIRGERVSHETLVGRAPR